jgi:hypothetical protein
MDLVHKRPKLEAWWNRARTSELGAFASETIVTAISSAMRVALAHGAV